MSDQWSSTKARLSIAQDLSEILRMFAALKIEAVNRAGDPDIPGGMAMVLLGPGADIEAFGYAQMSELMGRTQKRVWLPDKGDVEPPLSFLASWNDIIRDARGQEPSTRRARLTVEIAGIRGALDWMLSVNVDGEPWFIQIDDFARGLHKVRRAMEGVLHDGDRAERIRAECKNCEESPRLCLRRGEKEDGSDNEWYCPSCKHPYDADGVAACWRQMLVKRGDPPEWVTIAQAAAGVGRSPKTIRKWIVAVDSMGNDKTPKVASRRTGERVEVLWAEVRAADDTARRRGKYRTVA